MKRGPQQRENKLLSKKGLLETIQKSFRTLKNNGKHKDLKISPFDCLMSATAMFNLKSPSLLAFDQATKEEPLCQNLKNLYGVEHVPCDTYMREMLDEVDPQALRQSYLAIFNKLQRGNFLEQFKFFGGYLLACDGTGVFESEKVHCKNCCEKRHRDGRITYYHQLLAGAIVKPDVAQVIPLCPEPIYKHDGADKNDCEINAANRFLDNLKCEHPRIQATCTFDALFANAPFINRLRERKLDYIIVAKSGNNPSLFEWISGIKLREIQLDVNGNLYKFRYINGIPLNNTKDAPEVNFFECEATEVDGKRTLVKKFSWITSHKITDSKIHTLMLGGRAKWKIENETFNTLKNQGYQFEHNFGHGKKYLHTIFALLMVLSFLIDQVQEASDGLFRAALQKVKTRRALWEKIKIFFYGFLIESWDHLFKAIVFGYKHTKIELNTS